MPQSAPSATVGQAWSESRLLAAAIWCERVLDFRAVPPMMEE
jgi:hypothetical protein